MNTPADKMMIDYLRQSPDIKSSSYFYIDQSRVDDTTIEINTISCYKRGNGIASECMRLLMNLADLYQVTITLEVGPDYDIEGEGEVLNGYDLTSWYNRLGFDWVEGPVMMREPT